MLYGGPASSVDQIQTLRSWGFDFAEVIIPNAVSRHRWWESGIKSDPQGFFLVAHGPIADPADDVRSLWDQYFPTLTSTVDTAHRLGIKLLTVHMDITRSSATLPQYEKLGTNRELLRREKLRAIAELVHYARAIGVTISVENVWESAGDLAEALRVTPGMGITVDVGHGQLGGPRNRVFGMIEELGPSIAHVHVHDNDGVDDLHLPPGDGIIDIRGILAAMVRQGYDGTMTLEVGEQYVVRSRVCVERWIASPLSIQRR